MNSLATDRYFIVTDADAVTAPMVDDESEFFVFEVDESSRLVTTNRADCSLRDIATFSEDERAGHAEYELTYRDALPALAAADSRFGYVRFFIVNDGAEIALPLLDAASNSYVYEVDTSASLIVTDLRAPSASTIIGYNSHDEDEDGPLDPRVSVHDFRGTLKGEAPAMPTMPPTHEEELKDARAAGWDDACSAMAWAMEHGHDPLSYVAANNPFRRS